MIIIIIVIITIIVIIIHLVYIAPKLIVVAGPRADRPY